MLKLIKWKSIKAHQIQKTKNQAFFHISSHKHTSIPPNKPPLIEFSTTKIIFFSFFIIFSSIFFFLCSHSQTQVSIMYDTKWWDNRKFLKTTSNGTEGRKIENREKKMKFLEISLISCECMNVSNKMQKYKRWNVLNRRLFELTFIGGVI